jgi:hypothetical protein
VSDKSQEPKPVEERGLATDLLQTAVNAGVGAYVGAKVSQATNPPPEKEE